MGTNGFRGQRGRIRAYRASGRMFGQTFTTGSIWGPAASQLFPDVTCNKCGYMLTVYTNEPCPCGKTYKELAQARAALAKAGL